MGTQMGTQMGTHIHGLIIAIERVCNQIKENKPPFIALSDPLFPKMANVKA